MLWGCRCSVVGAMEVIGVCDDVYITPNPTNSSVAPPPAQITPLFQAPDLTGGFQTARFPKSPEVKDTIRKALQTNFVFSTLSPPEIEDFIDFMKMEKFMVGATVIKQGDPGDFFYVCEAGNFTYSVDGKTVGTAHPGSSFGEVSLWPLYGLFVVVYFLFFPSFLTPPPPTARPHVQRPPCCDRPRR